MFLISKRDLKGQDQPQEFGCKFAIESLSWREHVENSASIRDSYRRLPFQALWTWLTGKELTDGRSTRRINPVEPLAWSCIWLFGGICASILIMLWNFSYAWLIPSITMTVAGARYIVATIIHHGVHNAVFRSENANRVLCEILSTLTIVQPFDSYKRFHVYEHHGRDFSTLADQDLAAIYTLGLRPGVPVPRMKLLLLWQCFNPLFHLHYFWGRLKANLISVPTYRLAMTCVWLAFLSVAASHTGCWVFLVAVVLPLTILYQIASLLHLVTEHAWLLRGDNETVRQSHIDNSHARFCGTALPARNLGVVKSLLEWSKWILLHIFVHLPSRLLIVQGSLIVHDWHHRSGSDRTWPNAIQRREEDLQREIAQGNCTYRDIWGIHNAIHQVLTRISDAPHQNAVEHLKYRLN
jgi:fatty acid desaturase